MSITAKDLGKIYADISKSFLSSSLVKVTPASGDPPEHYKVTYFIAGKSRDDNGKIIELKEHVVEIAIPFGFPLFPPSCTPLTPFFHPDITDETISIDSFWNKKSTLPELIKHIGEMINGRFYSQKECLNPDALDWYEAHANQFPLAELQWNGQKKQPEKEESRLVLTLEKAEEEDEYPADQTSTPSFGSSPENQQQDRLDSLMQLKKNRAFFQLQRELEGAAEHSPSLQELLTEAVATIEKTEVIYQKARDLEAEEELADALKNYQKVARKIADYPAIQTDITRVEQTLAFMKEIGMTQERSTKTPVKTESSKETVPLAISEYPAQGFSSSLFSPWMITLLVITLLAAAAGGSLYFFSKSSVDKARALLESCSQSLDKKYYQTAHKQCTAAKETAEKAFLFFNNEEKQISSSATAILDSTTLTTGLKGKMLIDGKEYPLEKAQRTLEYKQKKTEADNLYLAGKFKKAAENYQAAIQLTDEGNLLDEEKKQSLNEQKNRSLLHFNLQIIEEQKRKNNPAAMQKAIEEASVVLDTLPDDEQEQFTTLLMLKKIEVQFATTKKEADEALLAEKWEKAIDSYAQTLNLAAQIPSITDIKLQELRKQQSRAALYLSLAKGNEAFLAGDWDKAIAEYTQANRILTDSSVVSQEESVQHNKRLKKIILQAVIIREQESIKEMLDNAENKNARDMYLKVLDIIENSPFQKEDKFSSAKQDIRKKLTELNHQIYIDEKKAYLRKNYRDFFARFYSNLNKSKLENPKATVTDENNRRILFRLQCSDKSGSRITTLVMTCRYDKRTQKWGIGSK